ncbi:hypothetical protein M409DRAFT_69801 [Zasmidium cellare ATCC 36951]|uniref:Major facilitator superfamily (MFS) profile domain-containing protein n=1 Tax=Zasmidium cellare ATCC 36951 TaxID=1080233 RepID=A0A6A6C330_ZASCE|nr:uncharacterized protein M409DRAFT_69801 [Zasmidium cellare ATCC 36951]KAF2161461.1 hypothetical protein M409DRAFT_69801 [Zasmidium cellare ATCC 36951]
MRQRPLATVNRLSDPDILSFAATDQANSNHLVNEEEALARARAQPDSSNPIWITFSVDDRDNPRNFPRWKKWYITALVSYYNFLASTGASGYTNASAGISQTYHVSREVSTLGMSMFVFGFALGPLLLAPLSEYYGRRPIYVVSLFVLFIFQLPIALAPNIGTILICRLLGGIGGSVALTNAGGSISDIWTRDENGYAMMYYALFSVASQPLSLAMTGYISQDLGWRWVFWWQMIVFGVSWLITLIYMPETRHSSVLERKARRVRKMLAKEGFGDAAVLEQISDAHNHGRKRSLHRLFARNLTRPFKFLFTEPITIGAAAYLGFIYAMLFMFNESFSLVFGNNHNFNTGESGLSFLGVVVGAVLAACCHPLQEHYYRKRVAQNDGKGVPEARMWTACVGAFFMPISLFWFAWTSFKSVPWIVPIIASAFWGAGIFIVTLAMLNYLVDSYQTYSASALAGANVVRNALGAVFPLFTDQMYNAMGYEWAGTFVACLSLLFVPLPIWWFWRGERLRLRSPWAREHFDQSEDNPH